MPRHSKSQVPGVPKSVRLTPSQWAEFKNRGGADWLRLLLGDSKECQHEFKTRRIVDAFDTCVECGARFYD